MKDEEALAAAAEATSHTLQNTAEGEGDALGRGADAGSAATPRPSPRLIPVIEMPDPDAKAGPEGTAPRSGKGSATAQKPAGEPSSATDLLPYLGGMEDGGGATSAIASAGVRDKAEGASPRVGSQPAHLYPPGGAGGGGMPPARCMCACRPRRRWHGHGQGSRPHPSCTPSPALLRHCAGRIIWIFPADEDKSSLDGSTAGREQGAAAAGRQTTGSEGPREEVEAGRPPAPGSGGGPAQVSMEEAVEEVEATGQGPSSEEVAEAARESGDPRATRGKAVPVAVEAKASSFERLLLLPDCFNDHLPDRYIEVLQQL